MSGCESEKTRNVTVTSARIVKAATQPTPRGTRPCHLYQHISSNVSDDHAAVLTGAGVLASIRVSRRIVEGREIHKSELQVRAAHLTYHVPHTLSLTCLTLCTVPVGLSGRFCGQSIIYSCHSTCRRRSETGFLLQTRLRTKTPYTRLFKSEPGHGSSRATSSRSGKQQVLSCGFMGSVCVHLLH